MDDMWSRIAQQNAEMDQNGSMAHAEARLAEHEAYARNAHMGGGQVPPPPFQPAVVRRLGGGGKAGGGGGYPGGGGGGSYQQNYGGQSRAPTEASLRQQEMELDQQLELERSLQRGGAANGGRGSGMMGRNGSRNKLQMPAPPSEKENRGKIAMLPGRGGAPSTSGGASNYAPSCRGGAAPSISGQTTASERARRPIHFSHLMDKSGAGHGQVDSVLNPVDGIRGQMKRAGIEPKNHERENRRAIKEAQMMRREQEETKQLEEQEKQRRQQAFRERSLDKAKQTLGALTEDGCGYEGGPPPTGGTSRGASAGRRSMRPPPTASDHPSNQPPPPPRSHAPGHVPAYLQRRKAEWQASADEAAAREAAAAECPPGLRLVGAEEKARILEKLAEERAKAMVELRQMPFVIKTNASQQKKDRLEARLEEIDGAEEAYMREKVFVPADM